MGVIDTLKAEPDAFCDALFAKGYIPSDVRDYTRIAAITGTDKARRLADIVIDRIKHNPNVFHGFIELLRRPSTDDIVKKIKESYETELRKQNICFVRGSSNEDTKLSPKVSFDDSFVCPFCKKCTLEQFFSPEGCPVRAQLIAEDSTQKFPYLDLHHMNPIAVVDLEEQLIFETENIKTKFADFSLLTKKSLAENPNNSLEDIKDCILSLEAFTEDKEVKVVDLESKQEIKKAKSLSEVFMVLRTYNYISFFNYQIIEHLIKHHGSADDRERLAEYLSALKEFSQRSVFEVPPSVFSCQKRDSESTKIFALKCTQRVITLDGVQILKRKVAQILGLRSSALQLCSIKKGCVELHFLVSAAVADHIFPVSPSQHSALSEIGIRVLSCEVVEQTSHQGEKR